MQKKKNKLSSKFVSFTQFALETYKYNLYWCLKLLWDTYNWTNFGIDVFTRVKKTVNGLSAETDSKDLKWTIYR